jgi:uncharacterized RDD family membrane protein YckC
LFNYCARPCYYSFDSRIPFGETSAAQNGSVIKTCQQCGAVNGDPAEICCFCDAHLGNSGWTDPVRRAASPARAKLEMEPEWRREVSDRVHSYRVRHGAAADFQSTLPFEDASSVAPELTNDLPVQTTPAAAVQSRPSRRTQTERFEISIPQRQIAYPSTHGRLPGEIRPTFAMAHDGLLPVAALSARRNAAILDAGLLLFSYGGMLALFWVLGGRIGFSKLDAVVTMATLALFYTQYFALFTVFGGCTPGMMVCGLRVLSFDGNMPTSRQAVLRSFGYLVSAATCFLGFLWALWDDDNLCWQDHISRTYLTSNEYVAMSETLQGPSSNLGRSH